MSTNYPTSLDSYTNPLSTDKLNSPSHADQHGNVNDAVEAIETRLGTGADTAPGAASKVFRSTSATASEWGKVALGTDVSGSLSIAAVSDIGTSPIPISKTALGTYTEWAAWTPTITVDIGTYTSPTTVARWMQVGKKVTLQILTTGTLSGAATNFYFTLPVAPANTTSFYVGGGCMNIYTGSPLGGWFYYYNPSAVIAVGQYGGGAWATGANNGFSCQISYEVA